MFNTPKMLALAAAAAIAILPASASAGSERQHFGCVEHG